MLSFIFIRFITRSHSLSLIVIFFLFVIYCHLQYHSLSIDVTRCEWMKVLVWRRINTKWQLANKLWPYKYPRFGKYVLHKAQRHSTQRHCLVFSLKESKFAEFFIWLGSKFHIWFALYGIEFRPYLSILGQSVTKRL